MRKLAEKLRTAGYKVMETREPGGTATGEKIRRAVAGFEDRRIVADG